MRLGEGDVDQGSSAQAVCVVCCGGCEIGDQSLDEQDFVKTGCLAQKRCIWVAFGWHERG